MNDPVSWQTRGLANIFLKINYAWLINFAIVLGPLTAKPSQYFTIDMVPFLLYEPIFSSHNTYLWWLPAKSSMLASSDHSTKSQSMCQHHLANPRRFNLFLWNSRGFLMAILPNSFLAWRFWQIVFFVLARSSECNHYFNCVLCVLPTKLTT